LGRCCFGPVGTHDVVGQVGLFDLKR